MKIKHNMLKLMGYSKSSAKKTIYDCKPLH